MSACKILRALVFAFATLAPAALFAGEVVITNQTEFAALVSGTDFQWDQNSDPSGFDYRLDPGGGISYTFSVVSGQQLTVEDGTFIGIAPNVTLRIIGELTIIDDNANGAGFSQTKITGTNESSASQSPWAAIEVIGDDAWGDADGKLKLTNVFVSGGGSGSTWASGTPDWGGLIRLAAPTGEQGSYKAELSLTNCTLQRSAGHGIVVNSAEGMAGAYIRVSGLTMNRNQEGSFDYRIQGCGFKLGDVNLASAANDKLENDIEIADADVAYCGLHGYFGWLSGGTTLIRKSSGESDAYFRYNGWKNPNYVLNGVNYYPQKGAGVFLNAPAGLNGAGDVDDAFTVSDIQLASNTWDGFRAENNWALTRVELSRIHNNSETGLWLGYANYSRICRIEKNTIYSNGFDGVFAQTGSSGYAALMIRANKVYSDKTSGLAGASVSEVRLSGRFGPHTLSSGVGEGDVVPEIVNNTIYGSANGVSILRSGANPNYNYATKIFVENNFIYSCTSNGLLFDYEPSQGQTILSPEVRNNVFHNHTGDGVNISANAPTRTDGDWIENNIFSNCTTDIRDESPDGNNALPAYRYNGFSGLAASTSGCAADATTSVFGNPKFVSATAGSEDFHLLWNSPLINKGDPAESKNDAAIAYTLRYFPEENGDAEEYTIDGSRNDIGAFGGPRADDYGFDPYNLISSAASSLTGTLKRDYYRATSSYSVPSAQSLTMEAGVFIGHNSSIQLTVNGELDANGTLGLPVVLTGWNQARWTGVYFNSTASAYSDLTWIDVSYPTSYGICFSSVPDVAGQKISLTNPIITHCREVGLSITNTKVEVTGNAECLDPLNVNPEEYVLPGSDEARGNTIRNIRGSQTSSAGVKIIFCDVGDVSITGTKIYLCGNNSDDGDPLETGVYIYDSDPTLYDCSIFYNGNTGSAVYLSSPAFNDFAASSSYANDFFGNGIGVGDVGGDGAAIGLWSNTSLRARYNDILDDEQEPEKKPKHGYLIWCAHSSATACVVGTFFGTTDVPLPTPGDYFYTVPQVDWQNNVGAEIDDDFTADLTPIQQALALLNEGSIGHAKHAFRAIIRSDPEAPEAVSAVRYLMRCYIAEGEGFDELCDYYDDLADEHGDLPVGKQAMQLAVRTILEEGDIEAAYEAYLDLAENGADEETRLLAYLSALELERILNQEDLDEFSTEKNERISVEVHSTLHKIMAIGASANPPAAPRSFELTGAFPNPFNSSVRIDYTVGEGDYRLAVFDLAGREVALLNEGIALPGVRKVVWEAEDVPAGFYICKLQGGNETKSLRLILVK